MAVVREVFFRLAKQLFTLFDAIEFDALDTCEDFHLLTNSYN